MKAGSTMRNSLVPRWISKPPPCHGRPTNVAEGIRTFAEWKATMISGETAVAEREISGMVSLLEWQTSPQNQIGSAVGGRAWITSHLLIHLMTTIPGEVVQGMISPWRLCRVHQDRRPLIQSETRMKTPVTGLLSWMVVGVGVGVERTKTCGCKTVAPKDFIWSRNLWIFSFFCKVFVVPLDTNAGILFFPLTHWVRGICHLKLFNFIWSKDGDSIFLLVWHKKNIFWSEHLFTLSYRDYTYLREYSMFLTACSNVRRSISGHVHG